MSTDSVVLEVAFVPVSREQNQLQSEIWLESDEVILPKETRDKLWKHGLRVGLVSTQLPEKLLQTINEKRAAAMQSSDEFGGVVEHRLQSRTGERSKIEVGKMRQSLTVFWGEEGYNRGLTLKQSQCLFSIHTRPQGDGRVQLELTPEIEHGDPRTSFVGYQGAWSLRAERKREIFEKLRLTVTLTPGESVMLSCTPEDIGLGHNFFVADDKKIQRLLLVRLAQVQLDDLFAPDQIGDPLVEDE